MIIILCSLFPLCLGFSLRLIFGHESLACEQAYSPLLVRQYFSPQHSLLFRDSSSSSSSLSSSGAAAVSMLSSPSSVPLRASSASADDSTTRGPLLCTLSFLCVYSFGMAAAMWWVMLTFTWFLSAAFHWVPEAITK